MTVRECGECTACCEGWVKGTIEGREMSPGVPCQHCTAQGCAIYERRPQQPCRDFVCGWLEQPSPLPDDMRPDQCGVIVKWKQPWKRWLVMYAIPVGESVPQPMLERLMVLAKRARMPMIIIRNEFENGSCINHYETGFGPPDFLEAVKNDTDSERS